MVHSIIGCVYSIRTLPPSPAVNLRRMAYGENVTFPELPQNCMLLLALRAKPFQLL